MCRFFIEFYRSIRFIVSWIQKSIFLDFFHASVYIVLFNLNKKIHTQSDEIRCPFHLNRYIYISGYRVGVGCIMRMYFSQNINVLGIKIEYKSITKKTCNKMLILVQFKERGFLKDQFQSSTLTKFVWLLSIGLDSPQIVYLSFFFLADWNQVSFSIF